MPWALAQRLGVVVRRELDQVRLEQRTRVIGHQIVDLVHRRHDRCGRPHRDRSLRQGGCGFPMRRLHRHPGQRPPLRNSRRQLHPPRRIPRTDGQCVPQQIDGVLGPQLEGHRACFELRDHRQPDQLRLVLDPFLLPQHVEQLGTGQPIQLLTTQPAHVFDSTTSHRQNECLWTTNPQK
jgi:hypothetical protein